VNDASGNITVGNNITVTGTLTGSTGVMNIGSGQIYKDASGNLLVGTTTNPIGGGKTFALNSTSGTSGMAMMSAGALGWYSYTDGTNYTSYVYNGGYWSLGTNNTEQVRISGTGVFSFNSGYGSAAAAYGCRAWCTYNGVTSTIVASANISSVTKNSTGYYTFNFSTAMPDANYSTQANVQKDDTGNDANAYAQAGGYASAKQTAALTYVITRRVSGLGAFDSPATYMAVFR
jgi:hypothetical protein